MVVDTAAPTGFIGWIQANGQLVLFFAQLIYWVVICAAAIWATLLFRKLVLFRTGEAQAAPAEITPALPGTPAATSASAPRVSVDEFVD